MFKKLLNLILPSRCLLCTEQNKFLQDVCQACFEELPWVTHACIRCGKTLPVELTCGDCLKSPPYFDKTLALFDYAFPIDKMITGIKFHHRLLYARMLGKWLADKVSHHYRTQPLPDLIIPIPLHLHRLRLRGFNQAIEIARPVSKKLNIPMRTDIFQRQKDTAPQSQLPAKTRQKNVKKAFIQKQPCHATHIAVIDDVMTTGSTANEFSRLLKQSGIKKIDIWCCARTLSTQHDY